MKFSDFKELGSEAAVKVCIWFVFNHLTSPPRFRMCGALHWTIATVCFTTRYEPPNDIHGRMVAGGCICYDVIVEIVVKL